MPAPQGGTPEELIRSIVSSLNSVDITKLSTTAQVAMFAERRRAAESLARIAGPPLPETLRVEDIPGYEEWFADYMLALEPFPDARRALADALRKRHGKAPRVGHDDPARDDPRDQTSRRTN